ncbi:MAG: 16S rRNA (adenine(1518)-N(6)/adenine(1519)-N(6))-dimethyltransferase RsmA [Pseudomonadota bacterium]
MSRSHAGTGPGGHRARKRFGQNFLHDEHIIQRIIDALAPAAGETIVEIGPGRGALTRHLVDSGADLQAIELDRDLAGYLQSLYHHNPHFTLHQGDVLKFDFSRLATTPDSLRVIGNLPYNISTPCLFHLLTYRHLVRDMLFMLQREVVDRMAAAPGDKAYGRLSVMLQYHCRIEPLFEVPPGAFSPPPKVTSAIVRLVPLQAPREPALDEALFASVVRHAFSQRRKTLKNGLQDLISPETALDWPVDPGQRPERLDVRDFVRISNALARQNGTTDTTTESDQQAR